MNIGSRSKQALQATLIYNPQAGQVNLTATIELVADYWRSRGWQVTIAPTQAPGHAMALARQAVQAGRQLVLAAGGDGTLGEVANGLAGTETIMAPLPAGTANSFARELGLPRPNVITQYKLLHAAEALAAGTVHQMDLGYTVANGHGRYWLLWAGAGVDGFLVEAVEPRPGWSKRLGRLGYMMQALPLALNLPYPAGEVTVDGRTFRDHFIMALISNCRRYAGEVLLSPQAHLDDGLFEVWLFHGNSFDKVVLHLWRALRGEHCHAPDVTRVNGREITITTQPVMPYQTDGEKAGETPLHCRIKPGALRLLVPDTAPADLFLTPGSPLTELQKSMITEVIM